jgi:hypothetical protein
MTTDRKLSNTILKLCVSAFLLLSSAAFSDSNYDNKVSNSVLYFIKYGYI